MLGQWTAQVKFTTGMSTSVVHRMIRDEMYIRYSQYLRLLILTSVFAPIKDSLHMCYC